MATKDPLASLEGDMLDVAPGVEKSGGEIKATSHAERLGNIADNSAPTTNGTKGRVQQCDVLVIGARFSGKTLGRGLSG